MTDAPSYVLITRPAESAARFASDVAALGYSPIVSPLIEHEPTGNAIPADAFSAIVVTSQTALRYMELTALLALVPVFTVGEKTARACREKGFLRVTCSGETVEELVESLAAKRHDSLASPVLYLSGTRVSHDLAALLNPLGITVVQAPLYTSRDCPFSQDAIHLLCNGSIAWITLFSRHTAEVLANEIDRLDARNRTGGIALACLSPGMTQEVGQFRWRSVEVAARPTEAALLTCLAGGTADGGERSARKR